MRLNTSTDYAIRLILYLAKSSKTVPSSKLSAAIGVSPRYLLQIGARLRDAGIINTAHGAAGGFALAKAGNSITLYDVIILMENNIQARPDSTSEQTAELPELKILDAAYAYVDGVLGDILKSITIENLLSEKVEEWYWAPCLLNQCNKTGE